MIDHTSIQINHKNLLCCDQITEYESIPTTSDLYEKFIEWRKENKKNKGENKMEKILELYRKNEIAKIDKHYNELLQEERDNSTIGKIVKKLREQSEKELKKVYTDSYYEMKYKINITFDNTPELEEAIKKLIDKRDEELEILKDRIEEIKALTEITETYEQKIDILKNYGILNKEGIFYV